MKMRYVYVFAVALVVWLAQNDPVPPHFYITPPNALMVDQLAIIRADRDSLFDGGTIELTLPVTFTGVGAGLINDPGPCTVETKDTVNVICYPTKQSATMFVFGRAGPHTSPIAISGQATSQTHVIGDTVYLSLGGVLRGYFPVGLY